MRKWLPLVAVCLGTFMLLVDVTIVGVALPDMATDLSSSFSSLQWVIDIYALVLAALLMALGSTADLVGRRAVYLGGLVLFALASLTCGLAPNVATLIAARGVQGVGGAAMFATTIALLSSSYAGRDRGIAFGVWGAVVSAAAAAGPLLGGLLTQGLSWRWIFFVNLPISVVAIVMSLVVFAADRPGGGRRLDVGGLTTFTLGATAITYGLIRTSEDGWSGTSTISTLCIGFAAFVGFVLVERRVAQPLMDLSLFRSPAFTGIMLTALLINAAAFSYLIYSSLWLQSVLGFSPVKAGLVGSVPMALAAFVVSASIGRVLNVVNPRWLLGGGMLLIGAGGLLQARLDAGSSWPTLMAGLIVAGVGVGLAAPTLVSSAMAAVPRSSGGMAAGAVNTARQLGYGFGIAVLGSLFQARTGQVIAQHGEPSGIADAVSAGQAHAVLVAAPPARRGALEAALRTSTASGLNAIFILAGALGLAAGLIALALMRRPAAAPTDADDASAPLSSASATTADTPADTPALERAD